MTAVTSVTSMTSMTSMADPTVLRLSALLLVFALSFRRVVAAGFLRPDAGREDLTPTRRSRTMELPIGARRPAIPVWLIAPVAVAALFAPVLGLGLAALAVARAVAAPRKKERRRRREWTAAVPDLVELVRLALGSGCTTHLSLLLIADHVGGPIGDMLQRTATSLKEGGSTAEALAELQDRVGSPIRPLCSALLGSERYGLPLAATLEALSVEARLARRRDAELRSRRLPVLLIFPLVVCILPAFALLTVVPLLGGGLSSLSW